MITRFRKLAAAAATIGTLLAGGSLIAAAPASAATVSSAHYYVPDSTAGQRMLDAAESRAGDWYAWGGAGPTVFDCSGLAVWAAAQIGIKLPHSTYLMLENLPGYAHLTRTYSPQRGDLAFFGPGHVELVTIWYHQTFGAQHTGTQVGWHTWNSYWAPTAYYRIG